MLNNNLISVDTQINFHNIVLLTSGAVNMLYADKRALETNLKVNLLAIREKELNYWSTTF